MIFTQVCFRNIRNGVMIPVYAFQACQTGSGGGYCGLSGSRRQSTPLTLYQRWCCKPLIETRNLDNISYFSSFVPEDIRNLQLADKFMFESGHLERL